MFCNGLSLLQHVKNGDLILGTIVSKTTSGMMLKVLCTAGSTVRYVADINVKVNFFFIIYLHVFDFIHKKCKSCMAGSKISKKQM